MFFVLCANKTVHKRCERRAMERSNVGTRHQIVQPAIKEIVQFV